MIVSVSVAGGIRSCRALVEDAGPVPVREDDGPLLLDEAAGSDAFFFPLALDVGSGAGAGLGATGLGRAYNSVHCLAVLSCWGRLRMNSMAIDGTMRRNMEMIRPNVLNMRDDCRLTQRIL